MRRTQYGDQARKKVAATAAVIEITLKKCKSEAQNYYLRII